MKKTAFVFALALAAAVAQTPVFAQSISAIEARDIALAMSGGGTISSLNMVVDGAVGQVYLIVVINNAVRYEVSINAQTGDVIRVTSGPAQGAGAGTPAASSAPSASPAPAAPARHNRLVRPTNPPISSARAVEIAAAHLASLGIQATFRSSKIDWERGRWVWEVEFRQGRIEYEFYIDVNTGEIVKFEIDR